MNRRGGRWPGGYISIGDDGEPTYVIERRVARRRFHVSTRTHGLRAAMRHLDRFEEDPAGYSALGAVAEEPLVLTASLVLAYRTWMVQRPRPTTRRHAAEMARLLADWAEDLRGLDLRRANTQTHLRAALALRGTRRQHRIIAIKGLHSWLRLEMGLLTSAQDATLDLAVPQAVPEKHRRRKAVSVADVRAALSGLAPSYRDCLLVLARTGWHVSELDRFARAPDSRIAPGAGEVLAVLQTLHKSGATTRTPLVDPEALAAARRIRDRGVLPRRLNAAIKAACRSEGVEPFCGGVLRHSVATWAIEAGTPAAEVAEFLGHRSPSTTLRFYADVAVPSVRVRLPAL